MCWIAALVLLLAPVPAQALEAGGEALVAAVIDGDTVVLDSGEEVRLVGIQAPKLSLGRASVPDQPYSDAAKAALESLTIGRVVRLSFGGLRRDRHGRWLAHLHDADGLWIQGALLARGMARVYTFADNRALIPEMLALEAQARDAGLGIWSDPFFAVLNAAEPNMPLDAYALVEGRVVAADVVRGRAYVNFGDDWRTDFTATIAPQDMVTFLAEGFDPKALAGRRVRVRGWLDRHNGPEIEATHPEQFEVLEP